MDDEYEIEAADELLMHNYNTLPDNCKKYWRKRYQLFSKYDQGIYMTSELWYSVTPENVAIFTARLFKLLMPDASNVLDICCGGGGNTIQFAREFETVGALDINEVNEKCTLHNAQIYGVDEHIWSYIGDWNDISLPHEDGTPYIDWIPQELQNKDDPPSTFDFIFASPPWGGPAYNKQEQGFDLEAMEPFPLSKMLVQLLQYTRNIGLFLPRNSNLDQIRAATRTIWGPDGRSRVISLMDNGHCFGLLVLFGPALTKPESNIMQVFEMERAEE